MPAFDPLQPAGVLAWSDVDLSNLPKDEDDEFEYKSSLTPDGELANKIGRAASGFCNSGGGVFVAGVDGNGEPDGGIADTVGKQSRRDWVDQAVGRTVPRAPYSIAAIPGSGEGLNIQPGKVVLVIGFGESYDGPHMAYDGKYYIRAGAHTVPASHYLVEAIRARRGINRPMLRPILRAKRHQTSVVELVITAVNDAPALDVEVTVEPVPPIFKGVGKPPFPIRPALIDRQNHLAIDIALFGGPAALHEPVDVRLRYHDILGRAYDETHHVVPHEAMPILKVGNNDAEQIAATLKEIAQAITGRR